MSHILPELSEKERTSASPEVAFCHVTYRPKSFQLFPTDIATELVATGNAAVSTSLLGRELQGATTTSEITDSSQRLQDLRNDVKYLDKLAQTEFDAARQSRGMWAIPEVREARRDIMDEVDFENKANLLQKLWRWLRGG